LAQRFSGKPLNIFSSLSVILLINSGQLMA